MKTGCCPRCGEVCTDLEDDLEDDIPCLDCQIKIEEQGGSHHLIDGEPLEDGICPMCGAESALNRTGDLRFNGSFCDECAAHMGEDDNIGADDDDDDDADDAWCCEPYP